VKIRKKGLVKMDGPVKRINKLRKTAKYENTLAKILGICSLKRVLNLLSLRSSIKILGRLTFLLLIIEIKEQNPINA
jgi:hypothetical protein